MIIVNVMIIPTSHCDDYIECVASRLFYVWELIINRMDSIPKVNKYLLFSLKEGLCKFSHRLCLLKICRQL